ncbi:hypothetical protein FRC12_020529 [Ceratobasidium sp. 428]|nr:hypothetical protein FRC12_020529 [Ceratobasidium sp. 428]
MLSGSDLQTASDVWGWAMAALELISGLPPYHQHNQSNVTVVDITPNMPPLRAEHPDFEKYALKPNRVWVLLERCWRTKPKDRPTIDEVVLELKEMAMN